MLLLLEVWNHSSSHPIIVKRCFRAGCSAYFKALSMQSTHYNLFWSNVWQW